MNFPHMTPISECFIKPKYEVEESKKPYHLSPWDLIILSCHYNQKGLLFTKPNHPNFSINNLLETLKDSLSLTLVHFYPLAGQFATSLDHDRHRCSIFVDCNKGPGVRFLHTTLNSTTISDILSPTHVPPIVKSFFDLSNSEVNYDGHNNPLLSVQVTEVIDGIFIGCSMNHVIVDGTSFWHFWNMWSELHRGLTRSPKPIHNRWVPKEYTLEDVFLPYTHPKEFITRFKPPQDLRERYFHFSSQAIINLKAKLANNLSSFQALVALVWRSIIRAKCLPRGQVTHCKMAANNRTRLNPPLPREYFGNSLGMLQATTTVGELVGNELGWVASLLNKSVANNSDETVRDFFKSWFESPVVYQLGNMSENNTVQVGSSPRFEVYGNEFSGLGKPLAVRSGYANKFGGKVILFPGCEGEGSVDVEICLPSHTMSALEADEEFMACCLLSNLTIN